jgi:hypothetical protein
VISVNTYELGYNVIKGAEYFVSLLTSVVAEENSVVISSEEFIGNYKIPGAIDEVSCKPMSL